MSIDINNKFNQNIQSNISHKNCFFQSKRQKKVSIKQQTATVMFPKFSSRFKGIRIENCGAPPAPIL